MNRTPTLLALLFLISMPACSSTRPPTPAAVQGNRIIAAVKDLGSAYERKNHPAFSRLISENFNDRNAFLSSIDSAFSRYERVLFTVHYTNMFIMVEDKGLTRATFNWDGEWRTSGGNVRKDGGRVTFLFEPKDAQLVSIEGKNPFVPQQLGRQEGKS